MDFDKTKTYQNLAKSFAGEAQAGMRYQLIARMATQQGYAQLADLIRSIAKNETVHARRFFEELSKRGQQLENIPLDAGYPFHSGDLATSLKLAGKDEKVEHSKIYPVFAQEAKEEGFAEIAKLFELVVQVEKRHEQVFFALNTAFEQGTLYTSEQPVLYICSECGYVHVATKAWDLCPLCKASQGFVEIRLPEYKEKA